MTSLKNIAKIVCLLTIFISSNTIASNAFPIKGSMKIRVKFWEKVYTEITTKEAFVHDSADLSIIYKKVRPPITRAKKKRASKKVKGSIAKVLRSIAKKKYRNLNSKERAMVKIIGKKSSRVLYQMAKRIRYQYGLKDRYYKGLIKSYAYMDYIKKVFKRKRLPQELIYLPHVESSFNYQAYSKVGAAGIWQFMRTSARLYKLKVGYVIDERRDPLKSTVAAAWMLKDNYRQLKSWPLALTAYNHGPGSVRRAVREVGSREIHKIVERYKGRNFGFASKNFYATFMATVNISKNPSKYFPRFKKPAAHRYTELKLTRPLNMRQISKVLNISISKLKKYNPAIRRSAYKSNLYIPKNYRLHIPKVTRSRKKRYQLALNSVKDQFRSMKTMRNHIISRGENLYDISRLYGIRMRDLIEFNSISNPSLIFAGMKIKIPGRRSRALRTEKRTATISRAAVPLKLNKYKRNGSKAKSPLMNLTNYKLKLDKIGSDLYIIDVENGETLGHYASWSRVPTQIIRSLNGLRHGGAISQDRKLKLRLPNKQVQDFIQLRNEYHLSMQENFFNSYKIVGKSNYSVKKGDTLTKILKKLELPYWLLRKFQTNMKLSDALMIGQKITIPKVKKL